MCNSNSNHDYYVCLDIAFLTQLSTLNILNIKFALKAVKLNQFLLQTFFYLSINFSERVLNHFKVTKKDETKKKSNHSDTQAFFIYFFQK